MTTMNLRTGMYFSAVAAAFAFGTACGSDDNNAGAGGAGGLGGASGFFGRGGFNVGGGGRFGNFGGRNGRGGSQTPLGPGAPPPMTLPPGYEACVADFCPPVSAGKPCCVAANGPCGEDTGGGCVATPQAGQGQGGRNGRGGGFNNGGRFGRGGQMNAGGMTPPAGGRPATGGMQNAGGRQTGGAANGGAATGGAPPTDAGADSGK